MDEYSKSHFSHLQHGDSDLDSWRPGWDLSQTASVICYACLSPLLVYVLLPADACPCFTGMQHLAQSQAQARP